MDIVDSILHKTQRAQGSDGMSNRMIFSETLRVPWRYPLPCTTLLPRVPLSWSNHFVTLGGISQSTRDDGRGVLNPVGESRDGAFNFRIEKWVVPHNVTALHVVVRSALAGKMPIQEAAVLL